MIRTIACDAPSPIFGLYRRETGGYLSSNGTYQVTSNYRTAIFFKCPLWLWYGNGYDPTKDVFSTLKPQRGWWAKVLVISCPERPGRRVMLCDWPLWRGEA